MLVIRVLDLSTLNDRRPVAQGLMIGTLVLFWERMA